MNNRKLVWLNAIGFVIVVLVNYLANALPINGYNTGELSDFYPNLFVPAGFTFGIWGLIYTLLFVFILGQIVPLFQKKPLPDYVQKVGIWFFLNTLANAAWIFAWHYRLEGISVILMLFILSTLIVMYTRLNNTRLSATKERWMARLPISVYLGWISIATIANITAFLVSNGVEGVVTFSEVSSTVLMISIGILLGLVMLWKRHDIAYALVVIWSLYGIYSKQINNSADVEQILKICLVGMILLTLGIIAIGIRKKRAS